MKRFQTAHETLIPLLVDIIGAEKYLEFGTFDNVTISKVRCPVRIGVDTKAVACDGAVMLAISTQEFIEKYVADYAPLDFVFIDADHSYAAAKSDFLGIWPFVATDGLVCLHDTNPETQADTAAGLCGDSYRMVTWLYEEGYEAVTLPYHPGLTIVRKRADE